MRKIIALIIMLLPCTAFATTNCQVVEYSDHNEVICVGEAEQTPAAPQKTEQEQIVGSARTTESEQIVASALTTESEQTEVPPEMIVRNGLARLYGDTWLRSRQGR